MSSNATYKVFRPTRLYIKYHTITGKLYFGKTVREDIHKYLGSGSYWINHIKKHGKEHVVTLWISDWFYDEEVLKEYAIRRSYELQILTARDRDGEKIWANLKEETGIGNGGIVSDETKDKMSHSISKTMNSEEWKNSIGKEATRKQKDTVSNEQWKETKGKAAKIKRKETISDPYWQETVGKLQIEKQKKTKSDVEWKNTTGKDANTKISKTMNSEEWKATVGKEKSAKQKLTTSDPEWKVTIKQDATKRQIDTINDPNWINENYVVCEYCLDKVHPGNYTQYHGIFCKKSPNYGGPRKRKDQSEEWKNTTGVERAESISKKQQDEEWKSTIGKEKSRKMKETISDPDWIAKNYKTCKHCKMINRPSHHSRYHDEKCRFKVNK